MNGSRNISGVDRVLVVLPARYGSSRFPGKALADLEGRPLIVRTAEAAARIAAADRVVIATDDRRIHDAVTAAGFEAEMTGEHATGSDRIGEVAARDEADIVVNLQGDEPLLQAEAVDRLIELLRDDPGTDIATCAHPFASEAAWLDPNQVKVLVDRSGFALYFSRAPLPGVFPGRQAEPHRVALRHVGIYAYRRRALQRFLELEESRCERIEGLEQLRALENGMRIRVLEIAQAPVGVDTPDDLEEVRRRWRAQDGTGAGTGEGTQDGGSAR